MSKNNKFNQGLNANPANFQPQTPLIFLDWAASVYPNKVAIIYGELQYTYQQFRERCRRLASAIQKLGVGLGDTVAVMAPNSPPMLEAHFGIPMVGAVLNAINYRLNATEVAFILKHGEAKILIVDREFSPVIGEALELLDGNLIIININDPLAEGGNLIGNLEYETFLAEGDPNFCFQLPKDEWDAISLNYTSGTTGNPKGVVYHHRGAFLNAIGNALVFGLNSHSVYLWTLPMFHCNGWCYTWGVTAVGGTHICLRIPDPSRIFPLIESCSVSHMCGAPVILNMMANAPKTVKKTFDVPIEVATGGAAPPSTVIAAMENMGFNVTHLYGLTESFGPSTYCAPKPEWMDLDLDAKAAKMARQGVRFPTISDLAVLNSETLEPVSPDGETIGELMLRGSTVMKGYLKNSKATKEAFSGGWFHTGDLGVVHPDGYVEIKDRSKDIILSGGENISSLEIEEVLYRCPDILEAAVIAIPDKKWGESPCAFVALKPDAKDITEDKIIDWCKDSMAHFKAPSRIIFGPLPKTSTGKIQKFVLRKWFKEL